MPTVIIGVVEMVCDGNKMKREIVNLHAQTRNMKSRLMKTRDAGSKIRGQL